MGSPLKLDSYPSSTSVIRAILFFFYCFCFVLLFLSFNILKMFCSEIRGKPDSGKVTSATLCSGSCCSCKMQVMVRLESNNEVSCSPNSFTSAPEGVHSGLVWLIQLAQVSGYFTTSHGGKAVITRLSSLIASDLQLWKPVLFLVHSGDMYLCETSKVLMKFSVSQITGVHIRTKI